MAESPGFSKDFSQVIADRWVPAKSQTLKLLTGFHSLPHLPREPLSTPWFRVFWYGWYGFSSG